MTISSGSTLPEQYPSPGNQCIRHHPEDRHHQPAVAYIYEHDVPELVSNGYAGYCGANLQRVYGVALADIQEIFGWQ